MNSVLLITLDENGEKLYKAFDIPERPFQNEQIAIGEITMTITKVVHVFGLPYNFFLHVDIWQVPGYWRVCSSFLEKNGWSKNIDSRIANDTIDKELRKSLRDYDV